MKVDHLKIHFPRDTSFPGAFAHLFLCQAVGGWKRPRLTGAKKENGDFLGDGHQPGTLLVGIIVCREYLVIVFAGDFHRWLFDMFWSKDLWESDGMDDHNPKPTWFWPWRTRCSPSNDMRIEAPKKEMNMPSVAECWGHSSQLDEIGMSDAGIHRVFNETWGYLLVALVHRSSSVFSRSSPVLMSFLLAVQFLHPRISKEFKRSPLEWSGFDTDDQMELWTLILLVFCWF